MNAFLLLIALGLSGGGPISSGQASCEPTPARSVRDVVGPMAGQGPVWMVDDGSTFWKGPTQLVKTLWVVAKPALRVEVVGRRRGGDEVVRFRHGSRPLTSSLVVLDANRESVQPGGARRDVLDAYAFFPSHVMYPAPGCWQLTVTVGDETSTIVQWLRGP